MRVVLDRDKCQGHGRCYALAPDLFDSDDDGYGFVIPEDGVIAEGQEAAARLAADNCPEFAITVHD